MNDTSFDLDYDDWLADLAGASLAAEGAWIHLVCAMRRERSGTISHPLSWFARFFRSSADEARAVLQELAAAKIGDFDFAGDVVTVTCRRAARDIVAESQRRAVGASRSRSFRARHASATQEQRSSDAAVTPAQRSRDADERDGDAADPRPSEVPLSSSPLLPPRPPSLASLAPIAPSSPADAGASPPAAPRSRWPEIPESLAPFERWHASGAVPATHVEQQRRFVERWPELLAEIARAFPTLDVPAELHKAYAWELASPERRKTPQGRAKFLIGWLGRSQNRRAAAPPGAATGPPPVTSAGLSHRVPSGSKPISPRCRPNSPHGPFGLHVGQWGGYLQRIDDLLVLFEFVAAAGSEVKEIWRGSYSEVRREQEGRGSARDSIAPAVRAVAASGS